MHSPGSEQNPQASPVTCISLLGLLYSSEPANAGRFLKAGFLRQEFQDLDLRIFPFFRAPVNLEEETVIVKNGSIGLIGAHHM